MVRFELSLWSYIFHARSRVLDQSWGLASLPHLKFAKRLSGLLINWKAKMESGEAAPSGRMFTEDIQMKCAMRKNIR
jgi:hypothetical protein